MASTFEIKAFGIKAFDIKASKIVTLALDSLAFIVITMETSLMTVAMKYLMLTMIVGC